MTRVAAADEDAGSSDQDDLPEFFCLDFYQAAGRSVADARWFNTYLQGAVFVGILGFVDAGYSGDWSRIGAISTELEAKLRFYALVLLGVHVVAAAAAGKVAQSRGSAGGSRGWEDFRRGFPSLPGDVLQDGSWEGVSAVMVLDASSSCHSG